MNVRFSVSTSVPGSIGGNPYVQNAVDHQVIRRNGAYAADLTGLQAETVYHVVVKVTDAEGYSDYAVGQFRTLPLPPPPPPPPAVAMWINQVTILENGDKVGKSRVTLHYKIDSGDYIDLGTYRVSDGDHVATSLYGSVLHTVGESGLVPGVWVKAFDDDLGSPGGHELTVRKLSYDEVLQLPKCTTSQLGYANDNTRCLVAENPSDYEDHNPGILELPSFVHFRALVVYQVHPEGM